jgi:hypothetical protein
MTINCPPCLWPTFLEEKGPSDDPSILLTGTARIGNAALQIIAIRIKPTLRSTLDCKPNVAQESYQANDLDTVLGTVLDELEYTSAEIGNLFGEDHLTTIELSPGLYRVWAMSTSFGA